MNEPRRPDVRNIAIIAHVDHGKTTLVDALLRQTGEFKVKADEAQETVLDSNELERERGITILAKCTSVSYNGYRINIVDTPGHADFGSEVERILKMVDGVLLLIDAKDGPMPQTRFVLKKSLELGLCPIVVINKLDVSAANPSEALNRTFDLFVNLGASDPQLDFPIVYASGRDGWASLDLKVRTADMKPLFETIVKHVPAPFALAEQPFQMLVTMLDYNDFVGRIGIGRISSGKIAKGQQAVLIGTEGNVTFRVTQLQGFFGLGRRDLDQAFAGDIVAIAGCAEVTVGHTFAAVENPVALPPLKIDEPTLSMDFLVNDSPFAGKDGGIFLTTRQLRERLEREQETNVGLLIEEQGATGVFKVSGRGELHLSILIETMRREGFELAVSRPQVIYKEQDGKTLEPAEYLIVDVHKDHQGSVLESLGRRSAELKNMVVEGDDRLRLEYVITARSLIGFKNELLTRTRGTGIMHHSFYGYIPKSESASKRLNGVMVAMEAGETTAYALDNLQERGTMFIGAGIPVYQGMIVGEHSRENDIVVNPCKGKKLSNMRATGSDDLILLAPPRNMSLEQAIEYVADDELVEVTPKSIRLRKKDRTADHRRRSDD
ncbi:MAG TPA: translational GTPase TypA [Elusimicrobiota bacterium]|nr:translational GTPase TypA [Elusimicrobiota bacterium]